MNKIALTAWIVLLMLSGYGLFSIKYRVYDMKRDVAEVNRQLTSEKDEIYVLKAEWTYLNQPERLRVLAEKHLGLKPISVAQIQPLEYQDIMVASADGSLKMASRETPQSILENELASAEFTTQDSTLLSAVFPILKPVNEPVKVRQ